MTTPKRTTEIYAALEAISTEDLEQFNALYLKTVGFHFDFIYNAGPRVFVTRLDLEQAQEVVHYYRKYRVLAR